MNSSIVRISNHPPPQCYFPSSTTWLKHSKSSTFKSANLISKRENQRNSLKCCSFFSSELNARNPSSFTEIDMPPGTSELSVADKLQRLVLEFKSLAEPMDRVKKLLHYASKLPPYEESGRVQENRVVGCATQVWVEVKMDENGRVRFRADSDSEISKGFCSCLIWVLNGAEGEEVLELKTEDFEYVNVGLHGRGHSRVNTWQNILITMQKKTRALVAERKRILSMETLSSIDEITTKNHGELQCIIQCWG
ncbi:sufE-like protein 2, chloroplastic isoform X2 [Humulus lupulus]|uniref:sufE-like protein 2, chloroplastic isoform X2 n=1 Tax=Humulus lupulus TaxID=3486 RepID=UPI002B411FC4|nr:sufE-like protein 2, chloroplastic isoform X2 [Humulus lupulus]